MALSCLVPAFSDVRDETPWEIRKMKNILDALAAISSFLLYPWIDLLLLAMFLDGLDLVRCDTDSGFERSPKQFLRQERSGRARCHQYFRLHL